MDGSQLLCFLVALLAVVMETESCMCSPKSLQDYYCGADFAVKATVSNWTIEGDIYSPMAESSYILNIISSFKLPANLTNEKSIQVRSIASDGLCGINPGRHNRLGGQNELGNRYFITGTLNPDGTLWSTLCRNTYRSWRWLSKMEKRQIRRLRNYTC